MPLTLEEIRGIVETACEQTAVEIDTLSFSSADQRDAFTMLNLYLVNYNAVVRNNLGHMQADIERYPDIDRDLLRAYLEDSIIGTVKAHMFCDAVIRHPHFGLPVVGGVENNDEARYISQGQALAAGMRQSVRRYDVRISETLAKFGNGGLSHAAWTAFLDEAFADVNAYDASIREKAEKLLTGLSRPVVEQVRFFEMFDEPGVDMQGYVDAMVECGSGVGLTENFSPDVRSFNLNISVYPEVVEITFYKNRTGVICHQAELKFTDLPTRDLKDYFHFHAAQETPGLTPHQRQGLDQDRKTLHLRLAVHAKVKLEKQGIAFTGAAAEDFTRNLVSMFLDVRQKWLDRRKNAAPALGPT